MSEYKQEASREEKCPTCGSVRVSDFFCTAEHVQELGPHFPLTSIYCLNCTDPWHKGSAIAPSREEKCPQCGKVMESPVPRKIIAIDFDPVRRKKFVGEKMKNFCSQDCGAYYQMGCEG